MKEGKGPSSDNIILSLKDTLKIIRKHLFDKGNGKKQNQHTERKQYIFNIPTINLSGNKSTSK